MKAIIYHSTALTEFDNKALSELSESSAQNNKLNGITGYLFYFKGSFFQYIEGEDLAASTLVNRIELDSRHRMNHLFEQNNISSRRFPSWSMKYIPSNSQQSLESLLETQFGFVRESNSNKKVWEENIWRCVSKIAKLQHQF